MFHEVGWRACTKFLLKNNFSSFDELAKSNNYQSINSFIQATSKQSPYYPEAVRKLRKTVLVSHNIGIHKHFLAHYQDSDQQVEKSLTKLYQAQKTAESYYQAYKLSNNTKDLYQTLYLANATQGLDLFIKKHPKINDAPNLYATKLKIFRSEKSSSGYLKAFAISQDRKDIKLAFDCAKNKAEEQKAEQVLGFFLYPMQEQAKPCLSGAISSSMRVKYPELTQLCDTPNRDDIALGLCLAIAGGTCEIVTLKIDNPILQKFPKSLCRKALSKVASGSSELGDFEMFHGVDLITYARKQSFSSDNDLIKVLFGVPLGIAEVAGRTSIADQCTEKLRSKCTVLYGVCR